MTNFDSRPFNREHAMMGAPYCQIDGGPASILSWDMNNDTMVGIASAEGYHVAQEWDYTGTGLQREFSLVMLPLGFIGNTPIYMGDQYLREEQIVTGMVMDVKLGFAGCALLTPKSAYKVFEAMPVTEASNALVELAVINAVLNDVQGVSGNAVERIDQLVISRDRAILELQEVTEALRIAENKVTKFIEMWPVRLA